MLDIALRKAMPNHALAMDSYKLAKASDRVNTYFQA
jgi:hypothetical protein